MHDLWPDNIETIDTKSPVAILQEQAALLGQKTKNLVKAQVIRGKQPSIDDIKLATSFSKLPSLAEPTFVYDFLITAPPLDFYTYRAFTIQHSIDLYPVRIWADQDIRVEIAPESTKRIIEAASEAEFIYILGQILATEKIRRVIGALLAQIEVVTPDVFSPVTVNY